MLQVGKYNQYNHCQLEGNILQVRNATDRYSSHHNNVAIADHGNPLKRPGLCMFMIFITRQDYH